MMEICQNCNNTGWWIYYSKKGFCWCEKSNEVFDEYWKNFWNHPHPPIGETLRYPKPLHRIEGLDLKNKIENNLLNKIDDLPEKIKSILPKKAQAIFLGALKESYKYERKIERAAENGSIRISIEDAWDAVFYYFDGKELFKVDKYNYSHRKEN